MVKGSSMIEDIGWTLILLLVLEVLAIVAILVFIEIRTPFFSSADPIAYSIDFLNIYNRPYMLAEVLTYAKFNDRRLLEQAIEVSAANSLEGASAASMPGVLASFAKLYNLNYYEISINREGKEVVNIQSAGQKCGDNLDGWCIFSGNIGCDVGRVKISSGKNACASPSQLCCKEDIDAYKALNTGLNVVECGNNKGICSQGAVINPTGDQGGPIYFCQEQRGKIETNECLGTNNYRTPVCCAPVTDNKAASGQTTKAVVPLLYKQTYGTLEVTIK